MHVVWDTPSANTGPNFIELLKQKKIAEAKKSLPSKIRLPAKTPLNCYDKLTTAKYQSQAMYMA